LFLFDLLVAMPSLGPAQKMISCRECIWAFVRAGVLLSRSYLGITECKSFLVLRNLRSFQLLLALLRFVFLLLVLVESFKISCNNRNRQRENKHSGNGAHCSNKFSEACDGGNITVADSCHGDNHPVEGSGDGSEARVLINLNEIAETGEDETADADKKDEQAKFFVAVLKSIGNSLEARRMTSKLENPGKFEDSKDL